MKFLSDCIRGNQLVSDFIYPEKGMATWMASEDRKWEVSPTVSPVAESATASSVRIVLWLFSFIEISSVG